MQDRSLVLSALTVALVGGPRDMASLRTGTRRSVGTSRKFESIGVTLGQCSATYAET